MKVKGGRKGKSPEEKLAVRQANYVNTLNRQRTGFKPNYTGPMHFQHRPGSLNAKKG